MKNYQLICFLLLYFFVTNSVATLVNGIVTFSWSPTEQFQLIDRFLTNNTQIQFKILCHQTSLNDNVTRGPIKKKKLNTTLKNVDIKVHGRIGRIIGCLPIQHGQLISKTQQDENSGENIFQMEYERLWARMDFKTFTATQLECSSSENYLSIENYSDIHKVKKAPKLQDQQTNVNKKKQTRRATDETPSYLTAGLRARTGTLLTWDSGLYMIEIQKLHVTDSTDFPFDIDITISMKNCHGGYITADEYPALIFYGIMCGIYALFAIVWFICCVLYWKELLKIQFWIGGVILIGMIEKSAFLVEYDTLNRHGYKVYYGIVVAELLSCFKRTISRTLVVIVAVGYGIVKPRLGPLKQKILAMGLLYFSLATIEAILRINTKNDETNRKTLISRIPLAVVDAIFCYWIFTSLVNTTRTLRLRKNIVKLNVYRHFTNTILFAIIASVIFAIWSLKSHVFTSCITDWKEFWVDDGFWHILFSIILLVIMFLFRPSNNNQRYAFVPLLDQSVDDDDDEVDDEDEEKGESALFDSITMRKVSNADNNGSPKNKKQQQAFFNREANVSGNRIADSDGNGKIEEDLAWVENNIPATIADQALQALDSEDEIVNTKLERSKMQ